MTPEKREHVIIAGFGCGGRFIAEFLHEQRTPFVLVELNEHTVQTQCELGVDAIFGNIADADVLHQAGIETASVLALTVPDESAALRATELARRIRPDIHIIASTRHTSTGMQARQRGADQVIVAEQVVGLDFRRRIADFLAGRPISPGDLPGARGGDRHLTQPLPHGRGSD